MTPTSYRVFGFSARAGDTPSWPAFRSRALPVNMAKKPKLVKHKRTGKLVPLKLSRTLTLRFEARGLQLRSWLNEYRERHLSDPEEVDQLIEKRLEELEDGRTQEIAEALLASTPESKRDTILEYFKDVERQHQAEEETSYLGQLVQALIACKPENGKVSAQQVREQLATLWGMTDEKGKPKKGVPGPRRIMSDLRTLGFRDTRLSRGEAGILLDPSLLEELKIRYCSESASASSESSEPNMKPSSRTEQSEDSEEGTRKLRSNISGEENLRPEHQRQSAETDGARKLAQQSPIVGRLVSLGSEKDLCTPCWNRKYQSMVNPKQTGPPQRGECVDCNGPASFRVRFE